jgi:predicted enzyme related to lactoylglutathione lyase
MTNIEKYPIGSLCWIELATTDQSSAKEFYSNLFGWAPADMPIGPDEAYTMFKLAGRDAGAAAYTLRKDQQSHGVPPHWAIYVAVESADAAANRVSQLGGKVIAPPFDVFDVGRMAVAQDPTGAAFCLWQAKQQPNAITGVDGTLCWADLSTPDPADAGKFYSSLLGWKLERSAHDSSGYLHIKNGEQFIGGIPPTDHRTAGPPHWLPYIQVSNCDAIAAKAKQTGASFHLEPMTMEGVGRMAVIADPQGAVFAIFQSMPRK